MQSLNNYQKAFLALVRAGLWETEVRLSQYESIDYSRVLSLAEEQAVVGLAAAGIEHVIDVKVPKEDVLQFVGQALQLEQRNTAMNSFIAGLVGKMRKGGIYTLLVKGQGIAQCYERPLWRASGDIDFLLSEENYNKAVTFLKKIYPNNKNGGDYSKETAFYTDQWVIEVHGSLRTGLAARVDKVVDDVQRDVFYGGNVRSWQDGSITVFLPSPDYDVFFVFSHFIKHFYKEGMNLRQVCDWCRLLWTYRDRIDYDLLFKRLNKSGLIPEWKAFASMAVEYLGMPEDAMPLYDVRSKKDKSRGKQLIRFILYGYTGSKVKDTYQIVKVFPWKAFRYSPSIFLNVNGLKIKERIQGK